MCEGGVGQCVKAMNPAARTCDVLAASASRQQGVGSPFPPGFQGGTTAAWAGAAGTCMRAATISRLHF